MCSNNLKYQQFDENLKNGKLYIEASRTNSAFDYLPTQNPIKKNKRAFLLTLN